MKISEFIEAAIPHNQKVSIKEIPTTRKIYEGTISKIPYLLVKDLKHYKVRGFSYDGVSILHIGITYVKPRH